MNQSALYLLQILVEMHRDTGKSDEELIEEFLSLKIENMGVDFEEIITPYGVIKLIHNSKGTCRKCRGSRKRCRYSPASDLNFCQNPEHYIDCPECGGTGECQHKNALPVVQFPELLVCPDCHTQFDRRQGVDERRSGIMPAEPEQCDHCKYYNDELCKRHAPITEPVEALSGERHLNVLRPIWPKMGLQIPRWCGDYEFLDRRILKDRREN